MLATYKSRTRLRLPRVRLDNHTRDMTRPELVCSCPGKVLVAGGYLVLDKAFSGLVVATQSRFYTVVRSGDIPNVVHVSSPQFVEAEWDYRLEHANGAWTISQLASASKNPFVQTAVLATVSLVSALVGLDLVLAKLEQGCSVTVLGDNDFYSSSNKAHDNPKLIRKLGCTLGHVHKTGLGSSAAMTTSLVAALAHYFSSSSPLIDTDLLHNLAQYVHSLAQGKIGSGFDVSSAVYGSHAYERFDPSCLAPLLSSASTNLNTLDASLLLSTLSPTQNADVWKSSRAAKIRPFALPPLTTLLLADVDAGSHTPSMVSTVLAWRKSNPKKASELWATIGTLNNRLFDLFDQLGQAHAKDPEAYLASVQHVLQPDSNPSKQDAGVVDALFAESKEVMMDIRKHMKLMGTLAGVEIEPDQQTKLLDVCNAQIGVLGGGVPGAGGLDAAWVLVLSPPSDTLAIDRVERVWRAWPDMKVTPLSEFSRVVGPGQGQQEEGKRGLVIMSLQDDAAQNVRDSLASYT